MFNKVVRNVMFYMSIDLRLKNIALEVRQRTQSDTEMAEYKFIKTTNFTYWHETWHNEFFDNLLIHLSLQIFFL